MDFGINRRSQRVVCVIPINVYRDDGSIFFAMRERETYTVENFALCSMLGEPYCPGIHLIERPEVCQCCNKKLAWPLHCFRPIDSRPLDGERQVEKLKGLAAGIDPQREVKAPGELIKAVDGAGYVSPSDLYSAGGPFNLGPRPIFVDAADGAVLSGLDRVQSAQIAGLNHLPVAALNDAGEWWPATLLLDRRQAVAS